MSPRISDNSSGSASQRSGPSFMREKNSSTKAQLHEAGLRGTGARGLWLRNGR